MGSLEPLAPRICGVSSSLASPGTGVLHFDGRAVAVAAGLATRSTRGSGAGSGAGGAGRDVHAARKRSARRIATSVLDRDATAEDPIARRPAIAHARPPVPRATARHSHLR